MAGTRMYITGVSPGRLLLPPTIAPGDAWFCGAPGATVLLARP